VFGIDAVQNLAAKSKKRANLTNFRTKIWNRHDTIFKALKHIPIFLASVFHSLSLSLSSSGSFGHAFFIGGKKKCLASLSCSVSLALSVKTSHILSLCSFAPP